MPVENRRIIVRGAPRADRDVDAVVVDRDLAQQLADQLSKDEKAVERELKALLKGIAPGRGQRVR